MSFTHKPGKGSLFKSDPEKKEHKNARDYNGSITLPDGTDCWMSGWINESKVDGTKFIGITINPKDVQPSSQGSGGGSGDASSSDAPDEDIPF